MTKLSKRITLIALSFVMTLCLAISLGSVLTVSHAQTTPDFYMETGAYVRLTEGSTGIRFVGVISNEKYDENASYGMLIAPRDYFTKLWIVENSNYGNQLNYGYNAGTISKMPIMLNDITPVQRGNEWIIRGSIANLQYNNMNREFVGIAYIKGADGIIDNEYAYISSFDDVSRSVIEVASKAINSGKYDSDQDAIDIMTGFCYSGVNKVNGVAEDAQPVTPNFSMSINAIEGATVGETYDLTTVMTPVVPLDVVYTSSNTTVATVEGAKLTVLDGGTTTITAKAGPFTAEYELTVTGPTKISTADEFIAFANTANKSGNYMLTADLDLAGATIGMRNSGLTSGSFIGTFDGNGYSISNFAVRGGDGTWGNPEGIFGNLISATVKNVAFKEVKLNSWSSVITGSFDYASKLENVYIKVVGFDYNNGNYAGAISKAPIVGTLTNVVIEYPNLTNPYGNYSSVLMANNLSGQTVSTSTWSNVYVISKTGVMGNYSLDWDNVYEIGIAENETGFTMGTTTYTVSGNTVSDGAKNYNTVKYTGLKRYDDRDKMSSANNDYSSFDSKYWLVMGGALYWHDTKVENISTVEQFKAFVETPVKNGLYTLNADLDLGGEKFGVCNVSQSGSFTGVFDGQGHSISNFGIKGGAAYNSTEGLFGDLKGATIKNVAFKNVVFTDDWSSVITGSFDASSKLENVYIQVASFVSGDFNGAISRDAIAGVLVNVVIDYPNKTNGYSAWGSVLMSNNINSTVVDASNWKNVYVISKTGVMGNYSVAPNYQIGIAENETEFKHGDITYTVSGNTVNDGTNTYTVVKYTGLKRFDDRSVMAVAGNDYTDFGTTYWKVNNGAIYWHDVEV